MGWTKTGTAWQDYDWQSVALIQELRKAYNERRQALSQSAATLPAAGDDFQHINIYKTIQDWIASNCDDFVRSHTAYGTPRATDYYDGEATIEMWTFADLCTAAGVTGGDFRRATTKPTDWADFDDAVYSAGRFTAGDIIGPWLPFDIQRMLNMLIWTKETISWDCDGETNKKYYINPIPGFQVWADAKADADTNWGTTSLSDVAPRAYSHGIWTEGGGGWFRASLNRNYSYGSVSGLATHAAKTVEFYIKAAIGSGYDFHTHGDDVIEDLYSHWDSESLAEGVSSGLSGTKIGQRDAAPNNPWSDDPFLNGQGWPPRTYRGWQTLAAHAVIRWNVVGGFEYVAP